MATVTRLAALASEGDRPAQTDVEQQIESALTRLDAECSIMDVREKYGASHPVLASVVDRSWVLHELLVLRQAIRVASGPETMP